MQDLAVRITAAETYACVLLLTVLAIGGLGQHLAFGGIHRMRTAFGA